MTKPMGRRSQLGAIVFNVAMIHAAGLVLLTQSQADAQPHGGGASTGPKAVQVRLAKAATAVPSPEAQPLPSAPEQPLAQPATDAPVAIAPFTPAMQDGILADLANDEGSHEGQGTGDDYIPRPQLSAPPRPAAAVVIPFPKDITHRARYTAILALFIDETGVVRRVRVDTPALPGPLEDAARETFLQAHFSPGEINGQHVKSLIRVEVVFDNTPLAAADGPTPAAL